MLSRPNTPHHSALDGPRSMTQSYPWEEPGAGNLHAGICEGKSLMAELLDHFPSSRRTPFSRMFPNIMPQASSPTRLEGDEEEAIKRTIRK
jgi:hypothetical protein